MLSAEESASPTGIPTKQTLHRQEMNEASERHTTDNEALALVDDKDQVISAMSRREIHARSLRHRAVHILVTDRRGRVLLQKRSKHKDVHPGAWDTSAAGHVDYGESYVLAAQRELKEELGIELNEPPCMLHKIEACEENGWEFVGVFSVLHDGPILPDAFEIDKTEWLTAKAVDHLIHARIVPVTLSFQHIWSLCRPGSAKTLK